MVLGTAAWLPTRRIGVEIEGVGVDSRAVRKLVARHGWQYDHDASLQDDRPAHHYRSPARCRTFEAVSPPLLPNQRAEAPRMLERLRGLGMRVNDSCGLHVHVDAEALSPDALLHLLGTWYHHQDSLHAMLGVRPSRADLYARPFPGDLMAALAEDRPASRAELHRTWGRACRALLQDDPLASNDLTLAEQRRYWGLNPDALRRHGTVEFRAFEATTDPDRLQAYIALADGLVEHATRAGRFDDWDLFTRRPAPARAAAALLDKLSLTGCVHEHFVTMSAQSLWASEQTARLPRSIHTLLGEPGGLGENAWMDAAHRTAEACLAGAQHLDLSGLSLTSLPPALSTPSRLQTVDLRHNLLPHPPLMHGHLRFELGHNAQLLALTQGLQAWATERRVFRRRRMNVARRVYTCVAKQQDTLCLVGREVPPFLEHLTHVRYLTVGRAQGDDSWVQKLPQASTVTLRYLGDPAFPSPWSSERPESPETPETPSAHEGAAAWA